MPATRWEKMIRVDTGLILFVFSFLQVQSAAFSQCFRGRSPRHKQVRHEKRGRKETSVLYQLCSLCCFLFCLLVFLIRLVKLLFIDLCPYFAFFVSHLIVFVSHFLSCSTHEPGRKVSVLLMRISSLPSSRKKSNVHLLFILFATTKPKLNK